MNEPNPLHHSYAATVSYHHTLVQTRFSVASLYMTATAFLIAAHLADISKWKGYPILIPLLGVALTLTAWFLELRTEALLANLVKLGVETECNLGLKSAQAFFLFVSSPQSLGVRIPFVRQRLPNNYSVIRYMTSHSLWLEVMYLSFLMFWLNAVWLSK